MIQNRLKHLRINAGLSVHKLAKRSRVAEATIYTIEAGRSRRLRMVTITRLTKALGIEPEDLFVTFQAAASAPRRTSTKWLVTIACPKCGEKFSLEVEEGEADPLEGVVACPLCGFSQILSLRRASS